jgi:hypothetical protein
MYFADKGAATVIGKTAIIETVRSGEQWFGFLHRRLGPCRLKRFGLVLRGLVTLAF